ncbi:DUF4265 domain-containing protein [Agromyces sp. SYSU K20354]|uniref:DUF4265 domain-containing protein n=1 Tax=Agromyces cavernae TaxID=2898659 RepID=UPI001E417917|nr:DUF4265 domain-containing protein [Agromyces cavernae]MCD2444353.1 DUF4265 domain-containing protein [Agromyces cavernae]
MDQFREHPSKACVWDGTQLVPVADATAAESVVWFVLPPDPDMPRDYAVWEALNATQVEHDVYRLCASPALFARVAFGDRVDVIRSGEGALVVTSIAGRGGYTSARLWFEDGGDTWRLPVESLAQAGCVVDIYSERLVGISWPSALDEIIPSLERMESEGVLIYATA